MRVAHLADVHLDSAFALLPAELGRERRRRIQEALRAGVELAVEQRVDAILIAGDLYEHERWSPDTGEFLRTLFADAAPVRVFIAPGNHDWYGPKSLYERRDWTPNVHIFDSDRLMPVELEDGLTLWGAAHRAPANTDDFLAGFRVNRAGVNVALFHGSEQSTFAFQAQGKMPYAPFRGVEVADAGLRHVFCGHFHTPADTPLFTYPGNPEPLNFGENSLLVRGLVLATICPDGSVERERVSVARTAVSDATLDVTGCTNANDVRERARGLLCERTGYVRLTVQGDLEPEVDLQLDDLRQLAPALDYLKVEKGALSLAYDFDTLATEATVRGQFVKDVFESQLPLEAKRRIAITGLRALEGRDDLEVM